MNLQDYAGAIASEALKLGAIRLSPQKPFKWASGYYMPIYNDNRSLLADWKTRRM
ncbi:MAG: orotate phosphoribosyltransferase, partial [Sphaerochaetaceae bacterium]